MAKPGRDILVPHPSTDRTSLQSSQAAKHPAPDAILLDRDGVIVEPVFDRRSNTYESPLHPADVQLVSGAARALAELRTCDVALAVVSNQPAAAKGTVPLSELEAVHERTVELLAQAGVIVDRWEYCFHHPAGVVAELTRDCDCRKPRSRLLIRALEATGTPPERAWMVGDANTDVVAGHTIGTRTALIAHPLTSHRRGRQSTGGVRPDLWAPDLFGFVQLITPECRAVPA